MSRSFRRIVRSRVRSRSTLAAVIGAPARDAATAQYSFDRMVSAFERLYTEEVAARVAPEALTWAASSGN